MSRLVMALDEDALIRLRRIITDRDETEALLFLREVLEPELRNAERHSVMKNSLEG